MVCVISMNTDVTKLSFEFRKKTSEDANDPYAFAVCSDGGSKERSTNNYIIQCQHFLKDNKTLKKIALTKDKDDKVFPGFKSGKHWIINLAPMFEYDCYDSAEVNSDLKGIYRYLDKEEVIYIGKGNIRERLQSTERAGWNYDKIEYSVIEKEDDRSHWEDFYISKFFSINGALPRYNKVMGTYSDKDGKD